jgi:hypothetical protein
MGQQAEQIHAYLRPLGPVQGDHFHSQYVWYAAKTHPDNELNRWILKANDQAHISNLFAAVPVLVSELYRLWAATPQPRTELVVDDPQSPRAYYVLSEEVQGFRPYTISVGPNPVVRNIICNDSSKGLASLVVISLLLGQCDLKDIGINDKNEFVHFDDDHALCLFWKDLGRDNFNFDITSDDLKILPQIKDYAPHQWLGYKFMGEFGIPHYQFDPVLQALSADPRFIQEKYAALLKIIMTPESLIQALVAQHIQHEYVRTFVINLIIKRKRMLEEQALLLSGFREYMYAQSPRIFDDFILKVKAFNIAGTEIIGSHMRHKFRLMSSPQLLSQHVVSNHDQFNKAYTKKLLTGMIMDSIRKQNSMAEVLDIIKKLELTESAKFVIQRNRNFGFSFYGHQYNGKAVNKTFTDIIKVAKNQMLKIALEAAKNGDRSHLEILAGENEFHQFLHAQRSRFFWSKSTSEKILAKASAAANAAEYGEIMQRYGI